ncbi:phosphatase PAP2 family protein [Planctomicrobium piriforme]|uniref:PAP2 superfamily protein n=1 Tax=Planctomicrobium piriforme TaxID=1576369 RepID=A0A1I3SUN4_9PLAN|nr:phosphatase PAP2 family protein [Planctomicrobium piriforme]SFJ61579.1 PAP2 superfamily protein [Planctomicrobium piriforme]
MQWVSTPQQAVIFPWGQQTFWNFLYRYGEIPGIVVGCCGIPLLLLSIIPRFRQYGRVGAFLCLTCCLGPGLLVNNGLKAHWGRPRPRDTVEFGGRQQFVHVGNLGRTLPNGSFPSGHAAIAFFVFAPAFLRCRWRGWRPVWLLTGLTFGTLVGIARVLQGGHFPTDVLWSLGIVYFCCWLMAAALDVERVELFPSLTEEFAADAGRRQAA